MKNNNFTILFLILVIIISSLTTALIILYFPQDYYFNSKIEYKQNNSNFINNINFYNLTNEEIKDAKSRLNKLEPLYYNFVEEFWVVKDVPEFCHKNPKTNGCEICLEDCGGFNYNEGKIITVQYYDFEAFEEVVCHEIAHSFVMNSGGDWNETGHQVVFDLAETKFCFEGN